MCTRWWNTRAGSLREPADLPVCDRDARSRDEYEPGCAGEPEAAVGCVAAAPTRERERGEQASDEPADVPADRDVRDREGEREVDHDQRQRVPAETAGRLPFENEHRAEDSEDGPRGS